MQDTSWFGRARCRGDRTNFYPASHDEVPDEAAALCAVCPVRLKCLAWALEHGERGVWGGVSETERKRWCREARRQGMTIAELVACLTSNAEGLPQV